MEPIFTDKQLNNMSREDLISLMKIVQEQTKKKDTEIQLLKDKQKELEFLNAMLSDRLTLAQRKQFGASSEKYAEGYEQMNLFNEAEANADAETEELFEEIRPSSYKCKKRKGKKEEDLSNFETVALTMFDIPASRFVDDIFGTAMHKMVASALYRHDDKRRQLSVVTVSDRV